MLVWFLNLNEGVQMAVVILLFLVALAILSARSAWQRWWK